MPNLTGNPNQAVNLIIRALEPTDQAIPDLWNVPFQQLLNNDANLNQRVSALETAYSASLEWFERIVQSGSNANGHYIRYDDGTQICWGANAGKGPSPQTITYPAAFVSPPAVVVTPSDWPAIHISVDSTWGYGTTQQRFQKYDAVGNEYKGAHFGFHFIAIGRWR